MFQPVRYKLKCLCNSQVVLKEGSTPFIAPPEFYRLKADVMAGAAVATLGQDNTTL